jgi:hypothetical protein
MLAIALPLLISLRKQGQRLILISLVDNASKTGAFSIE